MRYATDFQEITVKSSECAKAVQFAVPYKRKMRMITDEDVQTVARILRRDAINTNTQPTTFKATQIAQWLLAQREKSK